MAEKRKQLSNDIKNVIVEMRKSGHKLQEIADTLNIPRGTVSDVVVRFLMSFDNCLRFSAMMKISTFCSNIADDRFISGLLLKIEGLKIHCHKIDVYLFTRMNLLLPLFIVTPVTLECRHLGFCR
jgi:predicted DNA-binding protein YlxM (UPF0122 family)